MKDRLRKVPVLAAMLMAIYAGDRLVAFFFKDQTLVNVFCGISSIASGVHSCASVCLRVPPCASVFIRVPGIAGFGPMGLRLCIHWPTSAGTQKNWG